MSIEKTLEERSKTHGPFRRYAAIAKRLKRAMFEEDSYGALSEVQQEALEVIMNKIARILSGNPNEPDHWHDVAGYATLAEKDLHEQKQPPEKESPWKQFDLKDAKI